MQTGDLGSISLNPMGDWIDDQPYERLSIVSHNNAAYVATKHIAPGQKPGESELWMLMFTANSTVDIPAGTILMFGGRVDEIPPGFKNITTDTTETVLVDSYSGFTKKVWCGVEYNEDADFFYRCNNENGTGRSATGQYIVLPMASKYFMRGRDAAGLTHPYQYQDCAIENITGGWSSGYETQLLPTTATSGAIYTTSGSAAQLNPGAAQSTATQPFYARFDASRVVKTDKETRPMNFPLLYIIKLFDAVYNPDMISIPDLLDKINNKADVSAYVENKIINGGFQIDQEYGGSATAITTNTDKYVADQWNVSMQNGVASLTAQTLITEGKLRLTIPSGLGSLHNISILHRIEGYNVADLRQGTTDAKPFILSFRVKAPAGIYSIAIKPGAPPTHSYVTEYEITESNVEQDITITIPGCMVGTWATGNNCGMQVHFTVSAGADVNQKTALTDQWVAANNHMSVNQSGHLSGGTFELSRVCLNEGTTARSWTLPDYATELQRCYRYYEKGASIVGFYSSVTNSSIYSFFRLTPKRAMPTILYVTSLLQNVHSASAGIIETSGAYGHVVATTTGWSQAKINFTANARIS